MNNLKVDRCLVMLIEDAAGLRVQMAKCQTGFAINCF